MLITSGNSFNSYGVGGRNTPRCEITSSFQPADPTDLVEIGKSLNSQDRFIDLGPVFTVFGAGAGTIGGGAVGTVAYAFGAPGWLIPAAAVGGGILGGVIGHINDKKN